MNLEIKSINNTKPIGQLVLKYGEDKYNSGYNSGFIGGFVIGMTFTMTIFLFSSNKLFK